MSTVIIVLALFTILVFFIGIGMAIFAKGRRLKGLKISGSSIVAFFILALLGSHFNDKEAQELGYLNSADLRAAEKAGVNDPTEWAKIRDAAQAEKDRVAAELKKAAEEKAAEEEKERLAQEHAQREQETRKQEDARIAALAEKYPPSLNLAEYSSLSLDERTEMIAYHTAILGAEESASPFFQDCMGDFSITKNSDLKFEEVFGWCNSERENDLEAFTNHYNELAIGDLSTEAIVMCKNAIEGLLKAPATADHPWLPKGTWSMGRGLYVVKSYVDAQNSFGAMIRTDYRCEIKYDGIGEIYSDRSWRVLNIGAE